MMDTVVVPAGVFLKAEDNQGKYEIFVPNERLVITSEGQLKAYLKNTG